jgi:hypothetical protein
VIAMHATQRSPRRRLRAALVLAGAAGLAACWSEEPRGLAPSPPARTTVKFDFFHLPLPDIPLPNDLATRPDRTSATGLRVNASIIAPTSFERRTRELADQLDGWGTMQPIAIPFTGPLDVASIVAGHRDPDYATGNDVVYLVNVDPGSPEQGRVHHLDLGEGNYPFILENRSAYGPNDPRVDTLSLLFEEYDEDANRNGVLDPGEDTDADGTLDQPNYLPGLRPAADDLAGRADALMTFYERETNTLIAWPLEPLRERTTYAVVVTRRLLDEGGQPVGSPFPWIHHLAQTEALRPLPAALAPLGLDLDDVAFAFTYTTQSIEAPFVAVRDGLYGHGVQAHLASEYPADVVSLQPLRDAARFPGAKLHLLPGETWQEGLRKALELQDEDTDTFQAALVLDGQRYVDYYVIGSLDSPQLFARTDADGAPLPYNDQSWPPDLDRVPATAHRESVYFTIAVPRKEVSVRGQGKPAPMAILLHGHGGNRFDAMQLSAIFCKFGFAVVAIDGPTHGISLDPLTKAFVTTTLGQLGIAAAGDAIFLDRATDMDGDGTTDSGADFWTSYMFHTRDMVRQFTLDTMQTVRVLRGFDGSRRWKLTGGVALDGLAGDFDGDGALDVGGDAPITFVGGSLGGMMTMMMGGLEPEASAIAPIVGGGALASIGVRSSNGGAKVGFMIRAMSPIYVGTLGEDGAMLIETMVPDLIDDVIVPLASTTGVMPGDTVVVENLVNRARGCGLVDPAGKVRASVESDVGDATRLVFYRGAVIVPGGECEVAAGAVQVAMVDQVDRRVTFQQTLQEAGTPLVALAEGLGMRRGNPEFRRMQALGQLILDPGDPASFARHIQKEPLRYPGTGQATGAHAAMLFTLGDTSVPNSAGMVVARAAGLLPYLEADPRYGKPANQVLIDSFVAEGVHNLDRFVDATGRGVHLDIEDFSGGDDVWTAREQPRLDPPLRLGFGDADPLGGESVAMFALTDPQGDHGFNSPGAMIDDVRDACRAACMEEGGDDPCGCGTKTTFDVGLFLSNLLGGYLQSGGEHVPTERCMATNACAAYPPLPPLRMTLP